MTSLLKNFITMLYFINDILRTTNNMLMGFEHYDFTTNTLYEAEEFTLKLIDESIEYLTFPNSNLSKIILNGEEFPIMEGKETYVSLDKTLEENSVVIISRPIKIECLKNIKEEKFITLKRSKRCEMIDKLRLDGYYLNITCSDKEVNFTTWTQGVNREFEEHYLAEHFPDVDFPLKVKYFILPIDRLSTDWYLTISYLYANLYGEEFIIFVPRDMDDYTYQRMIMYVNCIFDRIKRLPFIKIENTLRVIVDRKKSTFFSPVAAYISYDGRSIYNFPDLLVDIRRILFYILEESKIIEYDQSFEEYNLIIRMLNFILIEDLITEIRSFISIDYEIPVYTILPTNSSYNMEEISESEQTTISGDGYTIGIVLILKKMMGKKYLLFTLMIALRVKDPNLKFLGEDEYSWMKTWTKKANRESKLIIPYFDSKNNKIVTEDENLTNFIAPKKVLIKIKSW